LAIVVGPARAPRLAALAVNTIQGGYVSYASIFVSSLGLGSTPSEPPSHQLAGLVRAPRIAVLTGYRGGGVRELFKFFFVKFFISYNSHHKS